MTDSYLAKIKTDNLVGRRQRSILLKIRNYTRRRYNDTGEKYYRLDDAVSPDYKNAKVITPYLKTAK